MRKIYISFLLLSFFAFSSFAQNKTAVADEEGGEYPALRNDAEHPCITPAQYKVIKEQCLANIKSLGLENVGKNSSRTTLLIWPLRTANGLKDCSYYYIGNYVDQDTGTTGIKDWNCGTVSYDGHMGTDLCTFPYPFLKMDNNQVEVVAAAAGTIVNRVDGHYDRNCAMIDSTANYIAIQHADGSCALYWHMKKNSLTSKALGQTVAAGEYLGVVGSSGSSTGPHLHFEILKGITINTLNDPYAGSCNILNGNSWWVTQKPYTEPAIIQTSVHPVVAVFPACPATETPNEDTCFAAGSSVKFYTFYRNETSGMVSNMRIINPSGSTFTSWTHNSNASHLCSYWISTKTLPTLPGTYTFEAVYNGDTCKTKFIVECGVTGISALNKMKDLKIYPDPSNGNFSMDLGERNATIEIYSLLGEKIFSADNRKGLVNVNISQEPEGVYFLNISTDNKTETQKIIIQK